MWCGELCLLPSPMAFMFSPLAWGSVLFHLSVLSPHMGLCFVSQPMYVICFIILMSVFAHTCDSTWPSRPQVSSCPDGTEAGSLDISKAYRNSPIIPRHKRYLCVFWKGDVYVQHVAIKGLATAGGIHGNVADATVAILKYHNIEPTVKWVDDFVFFPIPCLPLEPNSSLPHFNLT